MPGQVGQLVVVDRDGGAPRIVHQAGDLIEAPNWTVDGRWLVYNADGRLFRISVDGTDGPHRIDSAPVENLNNDHVLAPDGERIFVSAGDGHLYVLPLAGGVPERVSNEKGPGPAIDCYLHGISPDGATLVYVALQRAEGRTVTRIATIPSSGGPVAYLTDGAYAVDGPEFSPDGTFIYFNAEAAARRPGDAQIFRMRPDGSDLRQLTRDERVNWFPHPAPDGSILAYISFPEGTEGHPADRDVIVRTMRPDGSDIRDIDRFNGGQGTINVNSWAPGSDAFAYVRYPLAG